VMLMQTLMQALMQALMETQMGMPTEIQIQRIIHIPQ